MMRITNAALILSVGLLATAGGLVNAQNTTGTTGQAVLSRVDRNFMSAANQSNLAEIKTSQAALNKATGPSYKDFAQHMIDDHMKAEDELRQLAQSKNVTVPDDPGARNRAAAAKLDRMSGAAFDADYRKIQHDGHLATIALFKREIQNGRDADVKAFAQKYLPVIEDHYKMLSDLSGSRMNHGAH